MSDATEAILGLPAFRTEGRLPLVEAFGPTIQGEGAAAGRLAAFVRFGGCNLACVWCDSAYTWDGSRFDLRDEITMLTAGEVLARIPEQGIVVITGGEPLLNQRNPAFVALLESLKEQGRELHIETNGTIVPNADVRRLIDVFIVSPKLPHAEAQTKRAQPVLAPGWAALHGTIDAHMKVVVITEDDVDRAVSIARESGWALDHVWVMPEGTEKAVLDERWPSVCEWATARGVNASHRLHVLSWGDERGR